MSAARRIQPAKIARPIEIAFSDGQSIELTPGQYAEVAARVALELCKDCPMITGGKHG